VNPANSARSLKQLAALLSALLLGFVLLFGWAAWRSEREDQIVQLQTALTLSQKALDRYFLQIEAGLRELAMDLQETDAVARPDRGQAQLERYAELHPEAASINLTTLNGRVFASSKPGLVSQDLSQPDQPALQAFLASGRAMNRMDLGRPQFDAFTGQWIFPLRYVVRGAAGEPLALLSWRMPVAVLETFWRDAPLFARSSIGLLRDDLYLLSRYPLPASTTVDVAYSRPRGGALARALQEQGFPTKGYIEGPNQLTGDDHGNVFWRLANFPATVFISVPVTQYWSAWLQRVQVPYLLIAILGGAAALGYRYTMRNAQAWNTERRRAEAYLRSSEEEQRFLIDHLLSGLVLHGPDGAVLRANAHALVLFDMTQEQMVGKAIADPAWRFVREDGGVMHMADYPVSRVLHTREALRGFVIGVCRADSREPVWLLGDAYPEFDQQQALRRVVITFVDISERRRAEGAQAAQELAERANRAKSEFMARMSHELRTPLNAILGFAEVLELDEQHPLPALPRQRLQLIRQAGDHLLALINELLDLSRIESGTMQMQMRDIDVAELAQQVLDEVAANARERGIQLHLHKPLAAAGAVRADRRRMRQVLLNLISNSIKYTPAGGRVDVSVRDTGASLLLSVRDTGVGMNAEQLRSLFEPFNRLGREETDVEGTGIGLVITRGLVELMDGHIDVRSQPGAGTEFEVELPLASAQTGDVEAPRASIEPGASATQVSGQVLYIDDDAVNRVLMQAFLGLRPGVQLSLADDGESGLQLARRAPPDLLLVDLMMPTMSGLQVLQAVRQDPLLRHTPCLAVSANAMPHEISEALAAGFDGYLTKPLSTPVLLAEIDRVLGAH